MRALVRELEQRERAERHLAQLRATEIHDDIVQSIAALESAQRLAADLFVAGGRQTAAGALRRRG